MINYDAARKAIESLYDGQCTIYEMMPGKDPATKITKYTETVVVTNQSCRLSFKDIGTVQDASPGVKADQTIKLFMAPEITVKPGSKIVVTQNGITESYKGSGLPAIYPTHQEIILKAFEGWA